MIEEAITTIRENLFPAPEPYDKALRLGIEALEREKLLRGMVKFNTLKQAREAWKYAVSPLPSEGEKSVSS